MQTTHQDELAEARRNAEAMEAQVLASVQIREELRSSQQELQAKEVLFLEEKKRLIEEFKSAKQSLAPTVTANQENNESSPNTSQDSRRLEAFAQTLMGRLYHLNLLDNNHLNLPVLMSLGRNVASNQHYRQLLGFLREGPLDKLYCLTHVDSPASSEGCKQQGHTQGYCLIVRVTEKDSVRQLRAGFPSSKGAYFEK